MTSSHARSLAASTLLAVLALSACGSQSPAASPGATSSPGSGTLASPSVATPTSATPSAAGSSAASVATQGSYITYAAYAANPQMYSAGKVVLFFHAAWCPTCKEADKNLTGDPASIPAGTTVVKTDFDTATELRQQYGVTVQHTFVQVDATGGQLAKWSGSSTGADIAGRTV